VQWPSPSQSPCFGSMGASCICLFAELLWRLAAVLLFFLVPSEAAFGCMLPFACLLSCTAGCTGGTFFAVEDMPSL
jgi:hypothetical protein